MARIRTFIALELSKPIRDKVLTLQESLARSGVDVKWVEAENLHLTLLFLGEVDDRDLPKVCKVVAEGCQKHAPFTMAIENVGGFPNARRPRILWVGVSEGTREVVALHDTLEEKLLDLGCYRREERQYTPHLTLGRVKKEESSTDELAALLAKKAEWHGGEVAVREVLVMSSELTSQGPVYAVLSRAKLGKR
jgi:RNA 2',3'-cyclic 3'-phosphodiesterase